MTTTPTKRISQQAVAAAAGVSGAVVSVVLSGQSASIGVSEATRKRVLDTARQLGYRSRFAPTNPWGRAKTKTIVWLGDTSLAINDKAMQHTVGAFFQRLLHSVAQTLDEHQYILTFKPWREPEKMLDWLLESKAEGAIWRAPYTDLHYLPAIAKQIPVVVINHYVQASVDVARINQEENTGIALNHLWEHGHRRIAYFGFATNLTQRRVASYQKFMAEHGQPVCLEFLNIPDDPAVNSATKATMLLDTWEQMGDKRPTALVTGDVFALPIMAQALRRHINIPTDLSIIGIDNLNEAAASHPALTSMEQPLEELGRTAVEMLFRRINDRNRSTQITEIQPSLVVRNSVANIAC